MTQKELFDYEQGAIGDGIKLAGFLPYLKIEIDNICKGIENRVFTAISAGNLTPEQAWSAWMEYYSNKRMVKRLETKVTMGQSLGKKHSETLSDTKWS